MYDDHDDGFEMERAYDRAKRAYDRMQATEDRDTGEQYEPFPAFATQPDTGEDGDAETDGA